MTVRRPPPIPPPKPGGGWGGGYETGTGAAGSQGVLEQYARGSERRPCPPKARRSGESAIAVEALMNNAGQS